MNLLIFHNPYETFNYFTSKKKFKIFDIFNMVDLFSAFRYIAKYWNSDRIKLLTGNVCVLDTYKEGISGVPHRF